MAGRKAITIIIAVLLVTAITLAVALSAFVFIQKTQRSAQGIAEVSTGNLLERFATCGKLVSFKFNPITNMSEAVLRNCGFKDIDLGNDNLWLVVKTQPKSCSFTLNSANCANCVGKLGIGSFAALQINTSAIYCASTLADVLNAVVGQNVEVVITDKSSSFSAAATFVPEAIVSCGASFSKTPDIVNDSACYNYTLRNIGNAPDAFKISIPQFLFPGSPTINGYANLGCTGPAENVLHLNTTGVNQNATFSLFIDMKGGGHGCPWDFAFDITAQSTNCLGLLSRDSLNQTC